MLRKQGVVGKFVEFYGPGLASLTIADRATLGNMSPEYGATIAIFPIDEMTLDYLRLTGRDRRQVAAGRGVREGAGPVPHERTARRELHETLELDLSTIEPSLAGPKRPQDRVSLTGEAEVPAGAGEDAGGAAQERAGADRSQSGAAATSRDRAGRRHGRRRPGARGDGMDHGAVVVAAITSCTNTSNPSVMIGAGLLAKKAVESGLKRKPWVKTSLAPGSQVVTEYLQGGSDAVSRASSASTSSATAARPASATADRCPRDRRRRSKTSNLVVASVLSGNRNFEGRIQPQVRANYLASPPLVVAYALAGQMTSTSRASRSARTRTGSRCSCATSGRRSARSRNDVGRGAVRDVPRKYADVFEGDERWQALPVPEGERFAWDADSTYIRNAAVLRRHDAGRRRRSPTSSARACWRCSATASRPITSRRRDRSADSPAGRYLIDHGVQPSDFNSYGARRGNHEVMVRGTFANIRLRNLLAAGHRRRFTTYLPTPGVSPTTRRAGTKS